MDNELLWYWFVNIPRLGINSRERLLSVFHDPKSIWNASTKSLQQYLTKKQMDLLINSKNEQHVRNNYHLMMSNNIQFYSCQHPDFPEKLLNIPRSPQGIYLKGTLPPKNKPMIAVVGTRTPTPYGLEAAKWYLHELTAAGVSIVSGLAAGIDTLSHQIALRNKQYTLGVLGGGIDTMYPRDNFNLYLNMYEEGGVLSEYNMGIPNASGLFPERNRIISGLSDAVLIIEAAEKSGSLITAEHALEQGKDIYVVPGRITDVMSKGCNHLIHQGATLTQNPEDLLSDLRMTYQLQNPSLSCNHKLNPVFEDVLESFIYQALDDSKPCSVNEILHYIHTSSTDQLNSSTVSMSQVLQKLIMMEIKKSVTQIGNGQYVKRIL